MLTGPSLGWAGLGEVFSRILKLLPIMCAGVVIAVGTIVSRTLATKPGAELLS